MKAIILVFVAICSLPFFGVGLYEAFENYGETVNFVRTEGTVAGNSYQTLTEDGVTSGFYLPEVEFLLADGRKIRFTDKAGSLPPDYEKGAKVDVLYDPKNPETARINSWKRVWLAPSIFMTVGLLPLIIAAVILHRLKI